MTLKIRVGIGDWDVGLEIEIWILGIGDWDWGSQIWIGNRDWVLGIGIDYWDWEL